MTEEQRAAFAQLKALARPLRLRVVRDVEGFPVIPGRYGQIERYCDGVDSHSCRLPGQFALAVYTDHPRLFQKLWAIPGVKRHQTGDGEMRAVFLSEAIEPVAAVIRARRRRIGRSLSPEAARRLREARAGATSAVQEPRVPVGTGVQRGAGRRHALRRSLPRRPGEPA